MVSFNEQYVSEGSARVVPINYTIVSSASNHHRWFLLERNNIPFNTVLKHSDVVAIRCRGTDEWVFVVTCFYYPSDGIDLVLYYVDTLQALFLSDIICMSAHSRIT